MKESEEKEISPAGKKEKFVEGIDFYFENGFMVLSEHFLKKRGYCCGNNCRHCPYPEKPAKNG